MNKWIIGSQNHTKLKLKIEIFCFLKKEMKSCQNAIRKCIVEKYSQDDFIEIYYTFWSYPARRKIWKRFNVIKSSNLMRLSYHRIIKKFFHSCSVLSLAKVVFWYRFITTTNFAKKIITYLSKFIEICKKNTRKKFDKKFLGLGCWDKTASENDFNTARLIARLRVYKPSRKHLLQILYQMDYLWGQFWGA